MNDRNLCFILRCPPGSFLFYAIAKNSELLLTSFTTDVAFTLFDVTKFDLTKPRFDGLDGANY